MRRVHITSNNLKLFNEEVVEEEIDYFKKYEEVFSKMWTNLGKIYWGKALLTFRICILNYGFLKDIPPFVKKVYHTHYSSGLTKVEHVLRQEKYNNPKQFIQDTFVLKQYFYTSQTDTDENPFYKKDTREVFRKYFGNPEEDESSEVKMFCLLPIYLRLSGLVCRILKLWMNAKETVDPEDGSYCTLPNDRRILQIEPLPAPSSSSQLKVSDDQFISYIKKYVLVDYRRLGPRKTPKPKPSSDEPKSKQNVSSIASQDTQQKTSCGDLSGTHDKSNLADSEAVVKKKKNKKSKPKSETSNTANDNDNDKDLEAMLNLGQAESESRLGTKSLFASSDESDESDDDDLEKDIKRRPVQNDFKPDMNIDQEIAKQLVKNIPSTFALPKRGHSAILRPGECDDGMNMMLHFNTNPNDYEDHPNSKKDFTNAVTGLVQEMSGTSSTTSSKKPPKFRPDMLGKPLPSSSKRGDQIKSRLRKKLQNKESKNYLQDIEGNLSFRTRIEPKDDDGSDISSNSSLEPQSHPNDPEMRRLILERAKELENEKRPEGLRLSRQSLNDKQKDRAKLKEAMFSSAADEEDAAMLEKIKSKGPPYEVKFKIEPCVKRKDGDGNEITENLSSYLFDKMLKEREKEEEEREASMNRDESLVDRLDRQLIQVEDVKREHNKVMKDIFSKMAGGASVGPNDKKLHDDPDLNVISHKVQDVFKDICGDGVDIVCLQNESSPESSEDEFNFRSTREIIKELNTKQKADTGGRDQEAPELDNKKASEKENKIAAEEKKIAAEKENKMTTEKDNNTAAEKDDKKDPEKERQWSEARALANEIKAILENNKDPVDNMNDSRFYGAAGSKANLKKCSRCDQTEPAPKTFKKCLKCREQGVKEARYYCGKTCQAVDWKERHKREHKENHSAKDL